jgi:hypothetical protein
LETLYKYTDARRFRDFYHTGRIYFTTAEKKIFKCIVPNFMND